jgi:hypothetical protein
MTAFLDLNPLLMAYVLVVLLLILTMNVLNNCCMLLMIMFGVRKLLSWRNLLIFLP